MRKMYVTYIRPQLEYCSVLWSPNEGPIMDKIEKIQYDFSKLIPEIKNDPYEIRLIKMNLTSMERRLDRYKIFYVQKMLRGIVPNIGINIRREEWEKNGLMIEMSEENIIRNFRRE